MADVSRINGYDVKDKKARADIVNIAGDIADIQEELTEQSERIDDVTTEVNSLAGRMETAEGNISRLDEGLEQCFSSVSNGKRRIADEITLKGVQTSPTDTFQTMADNIRAIPTGSTGVVRVDWSKLPWVPNFALMNGLELNAKDYSLGARTGFYTRNLTAQDAFEINIKCKHPTSWGWHNQETSILAIGKVQRGFFFGNSTEYETRLPRIFYDLKEDGDGVFLKATIGSNTISYDFGQYWSKTLGLYEGDVFIRLKYENSLTTFSYSLDGNEYVVMGTLPGDVTVRNDVPLWSNGRTSDNYLRPAVYLDLFSCNWKVKEEGADEFTTIWGATYIQ